MERMLHAERKQIEKTNSTYEEKSITPKQKFCRKGPRCHWCGKFDHIKKKLPKFTRQSDVTNSKGYWPKANPVGTKKTENTSNSESFDLVVQHVIPNYVLYWKGCLDH